jgi:hypothetical protein
MTLRLTAPFAALVLLGGFTQAPVPAPVPAQAAPAAAPRLDSEQALTRLLALIRSSERVEEFTSDRLSQAFGVPVQVFEPDYWGFGERLSARWSYSIEGRRPPKIGARFAFGFNDGPGDAPQIDDICGVDYVRFTAELEAMGFRRQPYRGEHGRFLYDRFERPGMGLQTYPVGETVPSGQPAGRTCLKMLLIP